MLTIWNKKQEDHSAAKPRIKFQDNIFKFICWQYKKTRKIKRNNIRKTFVKWIFLILLLDIHGTIIAVAFLVSNRKSSNNGTKQKIEKNKKKTGTKIWKMTETKVEKISLDATKEWKWRAKLNMSRCVIFIHREFIYCGFFLLFSLCVHQVIFFWYSNRGYEYKFVYKYFWKCCLAVDLKIKMLAFQTDCETKNNPHKNKWIEKHV